MRYLLLSLLLIGCNGSKLLSVPIADNADAIYLWAGGTSIEIVETGAAAPVRVKAIPDEALGVFTVPLVWGCAYTLNMNKEVGAEKALFWLQQPLYITYDTNINRCGSSITVDWSVEMVNHVAEIDMVIR